MTPFKIDAEPEVDPACVTVIKPAASVVASSASKPSIPCVSLMILPEPSSSILTLPTGVPSKPVLYEVPAVTSVAKSEEGSVIKTGRRFKFYAGFLALGSYDSYKLAGKKPVRNLGLFLVLPIVSPGYDYGQ